MQLYSSLIYTRILANALTTIVISLQVVYPDNVMDKIHNANCSAWHYNSPAATHLRDASNQRRIIAMTVD